ncbi:hypothetical protein JXL19_08650 [bacterium]|nr:hypothetical protein [bacterium]
MSVKGLMKTIVLLSTIFILVCLVGNRLAVAQTWQALPPYNFLWPLWSPALSPVDPLTGLATPVVSGLYPSTSLPVQPGLAWNPAISYPYFLYNSPVGLQYYDIIYGINAWPPSYSLDPATGSALPIGLPLGYNLLPATDPLWIQENLPVANVSYLSQYPTFALGAYNLTLPANLTGLNPWLASLIYPTPAFSSLLTVADILGY